MLSALMAIDKSDPFPGLPPPWLLRRATKTTKPLPKSVTEIPSVTELRKVVTEIEATPKRGRKPHGDRPLTAAEKQRRYRERQKAKTP